MATRFFIAKCFLVGVIFESYKNWFGSGGIRTHASEETGALNQRLRPLGHATCIICYVVYVTNLVYYQQSSGVLDIIHFSVNLT